MEKDATASRDCLECVAGETESSSADVFKIHSLFLPAEANTPSQLLSIINA